MYKPVNIRPMSLAQDMKSVVTLWYQASILAHDFIDQAFWLERQASMEQLYLPSAETLVATQQENILGFASLYQDQLAALFVDPAYQGRRIGSLLLDAIRQAQQNLTLSVYEKNLNARQFYQRKGFIEQHRQVDPHTGEIEICMTWPASSNIQLTILEQA